MAKETEWQALDENDLRWIATQIHGLLPMLRERRRYAWGYKLIDTLLWFWTADAVHPDGQIRRDAIKYDPRHLHHTEAALQSLTHGAATDEDKVQHEHAGEKAAIIEVLEQEGRTVDDVLAILEALNVGVLVTKRQHLDLGKRKWDTNWRQRKWESRYEGKDIAVNPPNRRR